MKSPGFYDLTIGSLTQSGTSSITVVMVYFISSLIDMKIVKIIKSTKVVDNKTLTNQGIQKNVGKFKKVEQQ